MDKFGDEGCDTIGIFSHIAKKDEDFFRFLKDALALDPSTNGLHAIPVAKLFMAWESCKKRSEVETEANAQRAANHLPPQLAIDDYSSARLASEKKTGR